MSNKEKIKEYLQKFLLESSNNQKVIMLSGEWGSGKTYFWKNDIESNITEELNKNNRAYIYISLYGKDSIEALKTEVFIKSSLENKIVSQEISTFGIEALSSIKNSELHMGKILKAISELNSYRKVKKGINRLKDGGVVCFDDFERKSKNIDLNDLFGFITQLSLEMNCKVVIILNSDIFEGKEAEVFRSVKEKTVNKYIDYKPTIEELFEIIFVNDNKYKKLSEYKSFILEGLKETKELNARIYIQVLDNILEWIEKEKDVNDDIIKILVLVTVNFILNHLVFKDNFIEGKKSKLDIDAQIDINNIIREYKIDRNIDKSLPMEIIKRTSTISRPIKIDNEKLIEYVNNNKNIVKSLNYLRQMSTCKRKITKEIFNEINEFVKTGILI